MGADVKALAELEGDLVKTHGLLEDFIKKANGQFAESGQIALDVKAAVEKISGNVITLTDRCVELEQKLNASLSDLHSQQAHDLGKQVVDSEEYKAYMAGEREKARISIKTAIINATGQNQPLVPADRLDGIVAAPTRRLRMRDVLAGGRTTSNMIEFAKENVFTNNAGPTVSGSPQQFENVTKPESAITFTLATATVVTLAHWIPVSKQVLADSPMLQSYVNTRLMYGLKLKEDTQILLGTGANGELPGLYTNRTAYSKTSPLSYTTKLDVLRDAIRQGENSEYQMTGIVLHSTDFAAIELAKDTTGRYIFANPQSRAQPMLWGLPVVVTNSITAGTFLVGAFDMAAQLWDREDASIEIGLNSDNFVKNMRTILCEERLALTIYRATGLIGGSFTL
jgi:HK97 family phage major capsid protein